jgi:hypothetical protein
VPIVQTLEISQYVYLSHQISPVWKFSHTALNSVVVCYIYQSAVYVGMLLVVMLLTTLSHLLSSGHSFLDPHQRRLDLALGETVEAVISW